MAESLEAWLEKISRVHPAGWDLGLERVGRVARRMDILKPAEKVVLVAGTNGKGSTCEYLAAICHAAGFKVGKSTSPHLFRFNERICLDGEPVTDGVIVEAFEQIDRARGDTSLTYFEFATLASLWIFSQAEVDVAVLEIGLGGRLDAMNVVEPDLAVITSVSMDHESWLGDTREVIGREKAGILRHRVPCVLADLDPPESVLAEAERLDVPLHRILARDLPDASMDLQLPALSYVAAVQAAGLMGISLSEDDQSRIARDTRLLGRRTWINWRCPVLLDVAHNPAAAEHLAQFIQSELQNRRIRVVSGMYADKDIKGVFSCLIPLVDSWHLVDMEEHRAASAADLAGYLEDVGQISTYANISEAADALDAAVDAEDIVLVTGSFPVVAAGLQRFS